MSSNLDRLIRLIDSADFKTYSKLVLTSTNEDLSVLRSVLGGTNVIYLLIGDEVQPITQKCFWFSKLGDPSYDTPTKLKLYAISEVEEAITFIELTPLHLLISYELMRELRRVNPNCRLIAVVKVPSNQSECDLINLLTYAASLIKGGTFNFMLLINKDLIEYLKLLNIDSGLLHLCIADMLGHSSNIGEYLSNYRKVGVFTCFPKADLEVFGSLVNIIRFTHHLMRDYSGLINTALVITRNLKDLNSEIADVRDRLGAGDLRLINVRDGDSLITVITVEPNNDLILRLREFIIKAYDVIRESQLDISLADLAEVVG